MNTRPTFIAHVEPAKSMKPGHVRSTTQRVRPRPLPTLRELRLDTAPLELVAARLRVIAAVALDQAWLAPRAAGASAQRWNAVDQRQQLGDVVPSGAGEDGRQRDPAGFGKNVVLRPRLTAIGWVRSSFFSRATPGRRRCRQPRGLESTGRVGATRPAAPYAAGATLRRVASARVVASRCCPIHIPFPSGASATGSHSARRTGSRSTPPDWERGADPWISTGAAAASAAGVRSASIRHRRSDALDMRDCVALGHATVPIPPAQY